jgi:hypothetical protein
MLRCDKERLAEYASNISFDFPNGGGSMFHLNRHASAEILDIIDKSLERQVLNLRALLRKHNIPLNADVQQRIDNLALSDDEKKIMDIIKP